MTATTANSEATSCLQTSGTTSVPGTSSPPVYYQAGSAIYLLPGFTAQAGSSGTAFVASIGPYVTTTSLPGGTTGVAYSATLSAQEGTTNSGFTWTATGLPAWLSLNANTGTLSGTPETAKTYSFSVTASLGGGNSFATSLAVTVASSLTFITQSLPAGNLNAVYNTTVAASGGTGGGYAWSWVAASGSSLPPGLSLNLATGAITGTPTQTGTYRVNINVTDSGTNSLTGQFSISIGVTPTITTLSASPTSSSYGNQVTVTASVSPSAATGNVVFYDGGVLLNSGSLSGGQATVVTETLTAGSHSLTATYSGDLSHAGSTSAPVAETMSKAAPQLTCSLSTTQSVYGQPVTITGAIVPSVATGTIVFLDSATQIGSAGISGGQAEISATGLSVGSHGLSITYGGDANDNAATGSCLPLQILPSVQLEDLTNQNSNGSGGSHSYAAGDSFVLTIQGAANQAITTGTGGGQIPGPVRTNSGGYSAESTATNNSGLYRVFGTFGAGQEYIGGSWTFSVPAYYQTYNWYAGGTATPGLDFQVTNSGQVTAEIVDLTQGTSYQNEKSLKLPLDFYIPDYFVVTIYGAPNSPVTVTTTLPSGQVLGPGPSSNCTNTNQTNTDGYGVCQITGQWSSIPAGQYSETWYVNGTAAAAMSFTLIGSGSPVSITTGSSLPSGTVGRPYSEGLQAANGALPYAWSVSAGLLPAGLSLSTGGSTGGTISGVPTTAGLYSFTVTVQDANNDTFSELFTMTIMVPNKPYVNTTQLPSWIIGTSYNQSLDAAGGAGAPYSWNLVSGSLPPNVTLSSSLGTLTSSGAAGSPMTYVFGVTVTDSVGNVSLPQSLSITVSAAPTYTKEYIRMGGRVIAIEQSSQ